MSTGKQRVIIAASSAGQGPVTASQNVAQAIHWASKGSVATAILDLPKAFGATADLLVNRLYNLSMRRAPLGNRVGVSLAFRLEIERIERLLLRGMRASLTLEGGTPLGIVFTTPWLVSAALAGPETAPSCAVVLDLAPPLSPGWGAIRLHSRFFPTQEAKEAMGLGGEVTGAPVFPPNRSQPDAIPCSRCSERTTVLLMAGRESYASTPALAKALFARQSLHVTALSGQSARLYRVLRRLAERASAHVEVRGFVENALDLMGRHDIVATKPGTMSTCEALVRGKPLLLNGISGLMPQEVGNARFVVGRRAGALARRPGGVQFALEEAIDARTRTHALDGFQELAGAERIGEAVFGMIRRGAST